MGSFNEMQHNVTDSTDWIQTPLRSLVQVEQAFRCHVCKDFFETPMLTSCSHTFCSLCIRRALASDAKCPACRATDQESKLRPNLALREAVDAFVASRPTILQFATAPPAQSPFIEPNSPKRKAAEIAGADGRENHGTKRTRMSTRSSKTRATERTASMLHGEQDMGKGAQDFVPDDDLVACPMCSARMKEAQVNRHLDETCPNFARPEPPTKVSRTLATPSNFVSARALPSPVAPAPKPPDRLPGLAYNMLKDTAFRKKLTELRLPTHGSRQDLERRHKEWVIMWNANCDSRNPKTRSELLRDLDAWEKTAGSRAPINSGVGSEIKDKDFDRGSWSADHSKSFQDLIANARKSRARAQGKTEESKREVVIADPAEPPSTWRIPMAKSSLAENPGTDQRDEYLLEQPMVGKGTQIHFYDAPEEVNPH